MIDQFDILVTENNDDVTVNVTNNLEEVVDIFVAEGGEEIELNITNNIVDINIIRGAVNLSLTTNNNSGAATYDNLTGVLNIPNYTLAGLGGQAALNGLGFVKINGTTISYDNSTYLTTINGIAAGGELAGTYPNPTLVNSAVTGKLLSGVNITGGTIQATDSILTAFGKIQNQINGLIGGTIFQGLWNASTNSPSLASSVGSNGHYYIVSVAGSTNLNGITDWNVGDWAIFSGTSWQKVDNTDAVVSVNGFTGAVSLTTSNITEGTNLYYTEARVNANANVAANTAARHNAVTLGTANGLTLIGQQLSLGLASGSANGALSSTDWNTFNNKQNALTNPITGTGTTNFLPKFTGATTLGNSLIFDNGTNVGIGTTSPNVELALFQTSTPRFHLQNTTSGTGSTSGLQLALSSNDAYIWNFQNGHTIFATNNAERMRIAANGNVGIGTTSPNSRLHLGTNVNQSIKVNSANANAAYLGIFNDAAALTVNRDPATGDIQDASKATSAVYVRGEASNGYITFETTTVNNGNSTERMRITAGGNVGIGTTSPNELLNISGGNFRLNGSNSNSKLFIYNNYSGGAVGISMVNTSNVSVIDFNANVGTGIFSGSVTASGFFQSSDIRLKDIISTDGDMITYKWKDGRDNKIHYGYAAQNLQSINSNLVNKNDDGFLSVNYTETLVLKVRELEKQVELLKAQIN